MREKGGRANHTDRREANCQQRSHRRSIAGTAWAKAEIAGHDYYYLISPRPTNHCVKGSFVGAQIDSAVLQRRVRAGRADTKRLVQTLRAKQRFRHVFRRGALTREIPSQYDNVGALVYAKGVIFCVRSSFYFFSITTEKGGHATRALVTISCRSSVEC